MNVLNEKASSIDYKIERLIKAIESESRIDQSKSGDLLNPDNIVKKKYIKESRAKKKQQNGSTARMRIDSTSSDEELKSNPKKDLLSKLRNSK